VKHYSLRFLFLITTAAAIIAYGLYLGDHATAVILPTVFGFAGAVAGRVSFVRSWGLATLGIAGGLFVSVLINAFVTPETSLSDPQANAMAQQAYRSFVIQTWGLQALWFLVCGTVLGLFAALITTVGKRTWSFYYKDNPGVSSA
jgi:hypothetical protein